MLPIAISISSGEVIIIAALVAFPIAVIAFAGAGRVYRQIGKGTFAIDHDLTVGGSEATPVSREVREAEVRQMLEAKAYRQGLRGERPLDVEAELDKLLRSRPDSGADPSLIDEVRQHVIARNARRMRRGEEPLDVDAEIARQLHDLETLGH